MVRGEGGGVLPSFLLFGVWIMRMLKVEAGAKGEVLLKNRKWETKNFKPYTPTSDLYFNPSDVVFCRSYVGKVRLSVDQDRLAKLGYWAFKREGYTVLFPGSAVSSVG